jgi:hypothetical protein
MRRRWDTLIARGLPAERVGGENQANYLRFKNGAQVAMMAFQHLEQFEDIQGHQYPEIGVDEATNFPWFQKMMDKLKGVNRSPEGVPTHIFCTGNPGGPGHLGVKSYFRLGSDGLPPGTVFRDRIGLSRVYIASFLKDNQILVQNDPKYCQKLMAIEDPILRAAWLDGSWDVYIGQAFNLTMRHIIEPVPVPPYVAIYMTMDWGFGKPFSIGWWWLDSDDRLYRFSEWYGWNGVEDEGCRMEDSLIAEGIKEREHKLGIAGRPIIRLAGPDCWNRKPNYQGGGQGPSTAEVFASKGLSMRPGDPDRVVKIRAFRERLALPKDDIQLPKLVVYRNCKHFLRTIPALAHDEEKVEDIDTEQEDHVYDEACHVVMARAKGVAPEIIAEKERAAIKAEREQHIPPSHQSAWSELDEILRRQQEEDDY